MERERARQDLVRIGKTTTPRLIQLLQDRQELVRWEACRALMDIGDPSCVPTLLEALDGLATEDTVCLVAETTLKKLR